MFIISGCSYKSRQPKAGPAPFASFEDLSDCLGKLQSILQLSNHTHCIQHSLASHQYNAIQHILPLQPCNQFSLSDTPYIAVSYFPSFATSYFIFHLSRISNFVCVFSHVSCTQCHLSCVVFQISCFILHVSCIIFQKEIHISHILLLIVSLEESSPEEIVPLPGKSRSHRGYKSQVSQELPLFIFDGRDLYKICHHNCFKHTKKVPLVENL